MSNPMIQCRNLSVEHQGVSILKNINLEISSGQSLSIVGPNGAGKTTLLRSLAGLVNHAQGEIIINQHNPVSTSPKILSQFLVYLPQSPTCAWDFSVRDFGELSSHPQSYENWLSRFNLKAKLDSTLSQLSGGERKSVHLSLAFSMLDNPFEKIVLLDEPTTALDYQRAQLVATAIKEFTHQGASVLCTTHELTLAQSCSEILILEAGQIFKKGEPAHFPTADLVKRIGNK